MTKPHRERPAAWQPDRPTPAAPGRNLVRTHGQSHLTSGIDSAMPDRQRAKDPVSGTSVRKWMGLATPGGGGPVIGECA